MTTVMELTKLLQRTLTAMFCVLAFASSSCSNDEPDPEAWRKDLCPVQVTIAKPGCGPIGYRVFSLDFGLRIDDKNRESLFDSDTEQDYYIEYNGKKYFLGDTLDMPGVIKPIRITEHYAAACKQLVATNFTWDPSMSGNEPLEYAYTFVWPSKNIRKSLRVYVEFNPNYEEERKDAFENLKDDKDIAHVTAYKIGHWVDGESFYTPEDIYWIKL